MNYYMLRMLNHEKETTKRLFEDNYIAIGYRDLDKFEDGTYLEKHKIAQNQEEYLKDIMKKCWGELSSRTISSHKRLVSFLNFKKGDVILIPDYKTFHLAEVIEEPISFESVKERYVLNKNENPDIGFIIKIKKIKNNQGSSYISREQFADNRLVARMRSLSGFLKISDLKESIEKSKKSFLDNKVIKIEEVLKEQLKKSLIENLTSCLSPDKFEKLILKIMGKLGATNCDIPSRNLKNNTKEGHGDVDIVAIFQKLKHVIYIQAKFHHGESGDWALKQLEDYNGEKDLDDDYTTAYWAITTAEFNEESKETAKKLREEKGKSIRMIDKYELADLILEIGIDGLD